MKPRTKRPALRGWLFALTIVLGLGLVYCPAGFAAAAAKTKAQTGPAACLGCHGGSFDKLAAKPPSFKAGNNEPVNPHQYVPHNEKNTENVPDCLDCHTRHPLPPKEKIDLSRLNVDTCFLSCHHQQTFEPCGKCHKHK